ncbi:MAG: sigma 54-interacting transcriptional regulator [Candidatus Krumholzibacteriia bacterium]
MADQSKAGQDAANVFNELDRHVGPPPPGGDNEPGIEDLKRRYSIIETLLNVSISLSSTMNLEVLLEKIVDAVVKITGCSRGYLMLRDNGELTLALARSRHGKPMSHKNFNRSLSVIQKAAETGLPQVITDAQEQDDLRDKKSIVDLDIRTVVCIPLQFEENLVGVIYADSDRISERFSSSDLSILNAFGSQAAVAIENTRRHGDLEMLKNALETQNVSLRQEVAGNYEFSGIIGRSSTMQQIFEVIKKVSPLSTTVLIQGETGTGKELIAKAIHYNSARKERPMVSVNCGALPKDILESELFGYRKGSFTGADQDRAGLFEAASGGTIFLDEIGEMPVELQVKLLRTLQENEVRRLGEERAIKIDVRVIAATNKELAREVEEGRFRDDLFYRLNVVPVFLAPLRKRQEDILPLADHFLEKYARQMKKEKPLLSRGTKEMLFYHSWSGNVRELENSIERALALGEDKKVLDVDQFEHLIKKATVERPGEDLSLKKMLYVWERELLQKVLVKHSWNVTQTASALHLSRQQLYNKIKRFGLAPLI